MVLFGQLVIGPPGAGKTTYCNGMQQMCRALHRPCCLVNLDPANDELPYDCDIDIRDLIVVDAVMQEYRLGPNGALMYCMEYLLTNLDWLKTEIVSRYKKHYIIFDCPGQVELYTHHQAMLDIITKLTRDFSARLTAVHLVDSVLCTDPAKFISALLVSLSGQLLLELPHVNVLTKIDLLKQHAKDLAFELKYYAEVQDLRELLRLFEGLSLTPEHPFDRKYRKLNDEICQLIEDFNLIAFYPLDIQCKESVLRLLKQIDTANGYGLSAYIEDPLGLMKTVLKPSIESSEEFFGAIQEKYVDVSEDDNHEDEDNEEKL